MTHKNFIGIVGLHFGIVFLFPDAVRADSERVDLPSISDLNLRPLLREKELCEESAQGPSLYCDDVNVFIPSEFAAVLHCLQPEAPCGLLNLDNPAHRDPDVLRGIRRISTELAKLWGLAMLDQIPKIDTSVHLGNAVGAGGHIFGPRTHFKSNIRFRIFSEMGDDFFKNREIKEIPFEVFLNAVKAFHVTVGTFSEKPAMEEVGEDEAAEMNLAVLNAYEESDLRGLPERLPEYSRDSSRTNGTDRSTAVLFDDAEKIISEPLNHFSQ